MSRAPHRAARPTDTLARHDKSLFTGFQAPSAQPAASVPAFGDSEVVAGTHIVRDPMVVRIQEKFSSEVCDVLQAPLKKSDIEVRGDGIHYLPEMRYRRILNKAFGPGGWAMVPLTQTTKRHDATGGITVSREWALFVGGRCVSSASGKCDKAQYLGIENAAEAAKSNALMRCCKDLGVASELWDPQWTKQHGSRKR